MVRLREGEDIGMKGNGSYFEQRAKRQVRGKTLLPEHGKRVNFDGEQEQRG